MYKQLLLLLSALTVVGTFPNPEDKENANYTQAVSCFPQCKFKYAASQTNRERRMEKQNFSYSNYSLPITHFTKSCDHKNFHEIKKKKESN